MGFISILQLGKGLGAKGCPLAILALLLQQSYAVGVCRKVQVLKLSI